MRNRNQNKMKLYKFFTEGTCAHPDCTSGVGVEVHHILPFSQGGPDQYWNYVSLCRKCHMKNRFHSQHKENDVELYTWKSMQELRLWGFNLDEQSDDYYENLKILLLKYRS